MPHQVTNANQRKKVHRKTGPAAGPSAHIGMSTRALAQTFHLLFRVPEYRGVEFIA